MATEGETPTTEAPGTAADEAAAVAAPSAAEATAGTADETAAAASTTDAGAASDAAQPKTEDTSPTYPPPVPHGPILEVKTDLYYVRSSLKMKPLVNVSRNMIIVRNSGTNELTLLNAVRLSPEGEEELKKLGEIKNVVRLGMYHGRDDAYYKDTYKATFWAPGTSETYPEPVIDKILKEDDADAQMPFPDAQVLVFNGTRGGSECVILLKRDGGCLLTCDAIQYYGDWKFCSPMARVMMPTMGFRGCCIGKPWMKAVTPPEAGDDKFSMKPNYDRIMDQLEFDSLITAHGSMLETGAKEAVAHAISKMFPEPKTPPPAAQT